MDLSQILFAATEAVADAAHAEAEAGLLGTLGIDWKLFVAQLVNFAIVLFVLWKWVVKPLGTTLTERQNRIEQGLKNADYMAEEKEKFEIWKQDEMKKVRAEADGILRTTQATANQIKQDATTEAQAQADKIIEQSRASMEAERAQVMKEVKQEVANLVVMASEKILRSKLDDKKDKELIAESVKDIK